MPPASIILALTAIPVGLLGAPPILRSLILALRPWWSLLLVLNGIRLSSLLLWGSSVRLRDCGMRLRNRGRLTNLFTTPLRRLGMRPCRSALLERRWTLWIRLMLCSHRRCFRPAPPCRCILLSLLLQMFADNRITRLVAVTLTAQGMLLLGAGIFVS